MTMHGARVKVGAVQAAWDQATILRSADDQKAWPVLSERIAAATAIYGRGELLRGTVFLIDGALSQIGAGRPGSEQSEQFAERFTQTLLDKVSQWAGLVEPTDFPMVRQVVKAAFERRDPVAL